MKKQESVIVVIVALVALVVGLAFYQLNGAEKQYSSLVQVYETKRDIPPFQLIDQYGQQFDNQDLTGKWSLVFLGYLSCPDICPMTMAKLSNLLPKLNEVSNDNTQILFVSVDPQRDSVEKRKQYVDYFHKDIKGLGAEHKHLFPFVRSMGLMYSVPAPDAENYYVDHSASIALINPEGKIAAMFKPKIELGKAPTIDSSTLLTDFHTLIQ